MRTVKSAITQHLTSNPPADGQSVPTVAAYRATLGTVLSEAPSAHVLAEFGVSGETPHRLRGGGGGSWRAGGLVLKRIDSHASADFVADLVDRLPDSERLRIARPARTTAGTWTSAGWAAWHWLTGEPRTDCWSGVVQAGAALHELLRDAPRPTFVDERSDSWAIADQVAWGERHVPLAHPELAVVADQLGSWLMPTAEPSQLVHGDLTGNVLFADGAPPAVIDMSFYWRPPSWAAAVVAADALAWHQADAGVISLVPGPHPTAMVARAALFRLVTSDLHAAILGDERASYLAANAAAYRRVAESLCLGA